MENESMAVRELAEEIFSMRDEFDILNSISDKWKHLAVPAIYEALLDLETRTILILYLRVVRGWTLKMVGEKFDVSKERIRQIEKKGFRALFHKNSKSGLICKLREQYYQGP